MNALNLTIVNHQGRMSRLNSRLVEKQGLDQERVDVIKDLHIEKDDIFELMKNTDDVKKLKELAFSVENLEFQLQAAWKFPQDRNYHRWWEVPKCKCPSMDNQDNYGTMYRVIAGHCPIHSLTEENKKTK